MKNSRSGTQTNPVFDLNEILKVELKSDRVQSITNTIW